MVVYSSAAKGTRKSLDFRERGSQRINETLAKDQRHGLQRINNALAKDRSLFVGGVKFEPESSSSHEP